MFWLSFNKKEQKARLISILRFAFVHTIVCSSLNLSHAFESIGNAGSNNQYIVFDVDDNGTPDAVYDTLSNNYFAAFGVNSGNDVNIFADLLDPKSNIHDAAQDAWGGLDDYSTYVNIGKITSSIASQVSVAITDAVSTATSSIASESADTTASQSQDVGSGHESSDFGQLTLGEDDKRDNQDTVVRTGSVAGNVDSGGSGGGGNPNSSVASSFAFKPSNLTSANMQHTYYNSVTQTYCSGLLGGMRPHYGALKFATQPDAIQTQNWMKTLQQSGPATFVKNRTALWMSAYATRSHTKAAKESKASDVENAGAISGFEYRAKARIGVMFGVGNINFKEACSRTGMKMNGYLLGAYYSQGLKKGFGLSFTALQNTYNVDHTRDGHSYLAHGKSKLVSRVCVLQLSRSSLLKRDWMLKLNMSSNYIHSEMSAYTERDGTTNYHMGKTSSHTAEASAGSGLSWKRFGELWDVIVEGGYRYGYVYYTHGGGQAIQEVNSLSNGTLNTIGSFDQKKTHYFNLAIALGQVKNGWKFTLGVNSSIKDRTRSHTLSLKARYVW